MNDSSHTLLMAYQPSWRGKFEAEKVKLQEVFNVKALAIEHIGSTSVEGLSTKPIIDIAVLMEKKRGWR